MGDMDYTKVKVLQPNKSIDKVLDRAHDLRRPQGVLPILKILDSKYFNYYLGRRRNTANPPRAEFIEQVRDMITNKSKYQQKHKQCLTKQDKINNLLAVSEM